MQLQTEKPDWSRYTSWLGFIRRMLMAVSVSYRPELHYPRRCYSCTVGATG